MSQRTLHLTSYDRQDTIIHDHHLKKLMGLPGDSVIESVEVTGYEHSKTVSYIRVRARRQPRQTRVVVKA